MTANKTPVSVRPYKTHIVAVACCALAVLWCWLAARTQASQVDRRDRLMTELQQMTQDAGRIASLREAPRLATERVRPNDELLSEVRASLEKAGIPLERWVGNDPAAPVRVPKSPYKRLAVRLLLENVMLRQLVQFAYDLTEQDGALSVPRIRLSAARAESEDAWDVDLTVAYLIYAPSQER